MMAMERPWKLPSQAMISTSSWGMPLTLFAPFARGLERHFHRLQAGVGRQHRFLSGDFAQALEQHRQSVVAVGARRDVERAGLLREHARQAWMAVAVADRRVGAHHVQVAAAVLVPQMHALAACQCHRQRIVVVRAIAPLQLLHAAPVFAHFPGTEQRDGELRGHCRGAARRCRRTGCTPQSRPQPDAGHCSPLPAHVPARRTPGPTAPVSRHPAPRRDRSRRDRW